MVEYTPDEVDMLIQVLRKAKLRTNMLIYIIDYGKRFGLNSALINKLKDDLVSKEV